MMHCMVKTGTSNVGLQGVWCVGPVCQGVDVPVVIGKLDFQYEGPRTGRVKLSWPAARAMPQHPPMVISFKILRQVHRNVDFGDVDGKQT